MSDALISVCIPVYNGEQTIKKTIESVLRQTYKNIEIIVLDNCSTDKTRDIVSSFNDSRLKLIVNECNVGMMGNWNRCFDYASGEYMIIMCADDIITPDCIGKKVSALDKYPDAVLAFSASLVIDDIGKVIHSRHPFKKSIVADGRKMAHYSLKRHNLFAEPSNVVFRREIAEKAGRFDEDIRYSVDWAYWMNLVIWGKAIYIDKELTHYRVSALNETSRLGIFRIIKDDFIFIKKLPKELAVSLPEKIIHFLSVFARAIVRFVFMKLISLVWRKK